MPTATVAISKFVGSISLGLLTGLSYTLTTVTLPPLLALPTSTTCSNTLTQLRSTTQLHRTLLTTLSVLPLSVAYIASPRYARHPYLIWSILVASLASSGIDYLLAPNAFLGSYLPSDAHAAAADAHETTSLSEGSDDGMEVRGSWVGVKGAREAEEGRSEEDVNGEVVRARLERWRVVEAVKGSVAGMAFAMSVVGLWGDGY